MKISCRYSKSGFTLIELSIVLVIVGLIVGGVLIGNDLIKAARLRKIITNIEKYNTAVNTFRTKYNGLPGDIVNATSFWPSDTSCPDGVDLTTRRVETCNGNGDGLIVGRLTASATISPQYIEKFRFWQQLSNANLVAGMFTGTKANQYNTPSIGLNIPESGMHKAGISLFHVNSTSDVNLGNMASNGMNRHNFIIGTMNGDINAAFGFTPNEARLIDTKIDDGFPRTGTAVATAYDPLCTDDNINAGNAYKNSDDFILAGWPTGRGCAMFIKAQF